MKTLEYRVEIHAPSTTVWNTLVEAEPYEVWTKAFSANSRFEGDWVQGTEVRFVDPDRGGTKAVLEVVEPGRRLLARHIALIDRDGTESTAGPMADKWLGTTEDYLLSETGGCSTLTVVIETHEDFVAMFESAWPDALASIKALSEGIGSGLPGGMS